MRPSVLDDLGLHAAFRWLAEDGRQRLQVAVELHIEGVEDTSRARRVAGQTELNCPALYETALFRIAQESLTNVARHAHAQRVSISLTQDQEYIRLHVLDDGCGYDPVQHQQGLGIFGMRERAALLSGTVTIRSQPGQGTTVQALLPLSAIEEAAHA